MASVTPQINDDWDGVCPFEDCPYYVAEGDGDCGNHEEWMT